MQIDYSESRFLENAVVNLARERGFNGNPFVRNPQLIGTLQQQHDTINLSLDAQARAAPTSPEGREFIKKLSRNIVLTSTGDAVVPAVEPKRKRKGRWWKL